MRDGKRKFLEIGTTLYTCKKHCTFGAFLPTDAKIAKEKLEQRIDRVPRQVNVSCGVQMFRVIYSIASPRISRFCPN